MNPQQFQAEARDLPGRRETISYYERLDRKPFLPLDVARSVSEW